MNKREKVAIIGAGPAGITAAIYLKRANINPIIFTSEVIGGKAYKTLIIENYPGTKHMTGDQFCQSLEAQINYLKIEVRYETVNKIKQTTTQNFLIETDSQKYQFEKIIIATGTRERKLPVKNALKLEGKGISYCSSCDGYFFKNKVIAVAGGGNSAVEESKILAKIGKKVIILNRNEKLHAEKMLIDDVKKIKNIEIKNRVEIKTLISQADKLSALLLFNQKTQKEEKIAADGLFVYIGALPNVGFLSFDQIIVDQNNYIITDQNFMTKINNLYAVGDIVSDHIQQYTTAIGSATTAALDIIKKT